MNKIIISTSKYISLALLILGLLSCNNSGGGTSTGIQNPTATNSTDSNIGILPGGSVVYSSSSKYTLPVDKTTSGTFILLDGKNENGVFEISVTPANNQNDITRLPSVKVLSESKQNHDYQLSSKTHGVYSVEINAKNASPGTYIMTPEFLGDNGHKTKLNSLVLEITNSTQSKGNLRMTTTNLKEQPSATNPGNLSIAFIYSQNQHIPQFAIVTLSNSYDVSNLPVKVSILGKKGISGNNINTVCNFSSSVPNNFCYVHLPNDSTWTQGILTVSANGYTSISKHFLRNGYLTLQVNSNIVANNQKNILKVNLVNSENVLGLPVEVSIYGNSYGAIGISNNLCTLSTNNPSCNVDLYGIKASNTPLTIKAYVQGTNQGNIPTNVYEPATAAITVLDSIIAGTNNGFVYLNGTMISGNGAEGTVDGSSIKLVNVDTNGNIYAGTVNGYVYNIPNFNLYLPLTNNHGLRWQKYTEKQFTAIALDMSGNVTGITPANHIYVQNGGELYGFIGYNQNVSFGTELATTTNLQLASTAPSYKYSIPMAFWSNTPYFASSLSSSAQNANSYRQNWVGSVIAYGTNISNNGGFGYNMVDIEAFFGPNYFGNGGSFIDNNSINGYAGMSISSCTPFLRSISAMVMNNRGNRIYVGNVAGNVAYCSIGFYSASNSDPHYNINVNGLSGDYHGFGRVPDGTAINSIIIDNEKIYVATSGGHIYYYNQASSSSAWTILGGGSAPDNATITSIIINGGKVFASAGDSIYLVNYKSWEKTFSTNGDQINGIATIPQQ